MSDLVVEAPDTGAEEFTLSYREFWRALQQHAIQEGDVAGLPIPAKDSALRLAPGHPLYDRLNGQTLDSILRTEDNSAATDLPEMERVNAWERTTPGGLPEAIYLYRDPGEAHGRTKLLKVPLRHRWAEAATMLLQSFDVAMNWEVEAEERALEKLRSLVTPAAYRYYLTTGAFLESSPRSQVTYCFRRMRPTLALRPDPKTGTMKILAALCLHPLAWYEGTWAGAMVPTDDLIAHLLLMRGDEHRYWRCANQHDPGARESGL